MQININLDTDDWALVLTALTESAYKADTEEKNFNTGEYTEMSAEFMAIHSEILRQIHKELEPETDIKQQYHC